MPRVPINEWFGDAGGRDPLTGVVANLYEAGSTTDHGTLYDAEFGGSVVTQPLSSDANGRIAGWIAEGAYDLVITGGPTIRLNCVSALGRPRIFNVKAFGALGDGAATDQPAFVDAIAAAAAAGGGCVFVPAGIYLLTGELGLRSNLHLLGCGRGVSILRWVAAMSSGDASLLRCQALPGAVAGGRANVTIDSLEIDGNRANRTTTSVQRGITFSGGLSGGTIYHNTNVVVKNCYVHDMGGAGQGIVFHFCLGAQARNNEVADNNRDGIVFYFDSRDLLAQDNYVHDCADDLIGLNCRENSTDTWTMEDCALVGNVLINNLQPYGDGIRVHGVTRCMVTDNVIQSTFGAGIVVHNAFTQDCTDITIARNIIIDAGDQNMGDQSVPGIQVIAGLVAMDGGSVRRCTISQNHVDKTRGPGIHALAETGPTTGFGIFDLTIRGNIIDRAGAHYATPTSTPPPPGIVVQAKNGFPVVGVLIEGNTVTRAKGDGIHVGGGATTYQVIDNPRIIGNSVFDSNMFNAAPPGQQFSGIFLQQCKSPHLLNNRSGNRDTSYQNYGLEVVDDPSASTILDHGNDLSNNTAGPDNYPTTMISPPVVKSHTRLGQVFMLSGTGSPQSVVSAPVGSIYLRSNGGTSTTLFVKESGSGNTGWVAK